MTWGEKTSPIQIGDPVRYSRRWLRERDRTRSDLADALGVVTAIEDSDGRTLATVEWDRPGIPDLVNVLNLTGAKERGR